MHGVGVGVQDVVAELLAGELFHLVFDEVKIYSCEKGVLLQLFGILQAEAEGRLHVGEFFDQIAGDLVNGVGEVDIMLDDLVEYFLIVFPFEHFLAARHLVYDHS